MIRARVRTICMGVKEHLPSLHPRTASSVTPHGGIASIASRFMQNLHLPAEGTPGGGGYRDPRSRFLIYPERVSSPVMDYLPCLSWPGVLNRSRNAHCADWRTCSTRSRTCLRFPSSIDTRKDCRPSGALMTATVRLPPTLAFGSGS